MTLRDFIIPVANTNIIRGSRPSIVQQLFSNSGGIIPVEVETAKGWLKPEGSKGHRNCRINDYFPKDKVDEIGFIHFFSSRIGSNWKQLQETFNPIAAKHPIDEDCIVNIDTDNPDVFYRSLLNQFLLIHRLPLLEELTDSAIMTVETSIPPEDDINDEAVSPAKGAVEGGRQQVTTQNVSVEISLHQNISIPPRERVDNNPLNSQNRSNKADDGSKNEGAQLHIPDRYKGCLFCKRWGGNPDVAREGPTYGPCNVYNNDQLSTDGKNCPNFQPNESRITPEIIWNKIKNNRGSLQ